MNSTWPVSQTVKTLRSQRREYGFESHTGHQWKKPTAGGNNAVGFLHGKDSFELRAMSFEFERGQIFLKR